MWLVVVAVVQVLQQSLCGCWVHLCVVVWLFVWLMCVVVSSIGVGTTTGAVAATDVGDPRGGVTV